MTLNSAASRMSGELRNLMNITEQALRRGYRENATKPKASSTRQSERRVRLPTMSHTTGKDSTVLFPLTHQQPQPPFLVSWGNLSPPPHHPRSALPFMWIICKSKLDLMMPRHLLSRSYVKVLKISAPLPTRWLTAVEQGGAAVMQRLAGAAKNYLF